MSRLNRIFRIACVALLCVNVQRTCHAQGPLAADVLPAGTVDRQALPVERAYQYEFDDVQVSQIEGWLKWLRYELPVDVSGQVSGWLWAQRSSKGWLNFSDYRVEGEIESPQLLVDSWMVEQASLRFGYIDGVWYVGRLAGRVSQSALANQEPQRVIGQAQLRASLPMASPRLLRIAGNVDQILLQPLLDAFELRSDVDIEIDNAPGQLVFEGQVPLAAAADIGQWKLAGQIDVDPVRLQVGGRVDLPELSLVSPLRLEAGQWTLTQAQVGVADQTLQVDAQGNLNDVRLPYALSASGQNVDLAAVIAAFSSATLDSPERLPMVEGPVGLIGRMTGSVSEGLQSASFEVSATEILAVGERFTKVRLLANVPIDAGELQGLEVQLQQANLMGSSLRGLVTWSSVAELARGVPSRIALDFEQLDLGGLEPARLPIALRGIADGQVRLHIPHQQAAHDWSGDVRLRIRDLVAEETWLGDAFLSATKTATIPQIQFALRDGQQTVSMQGTCDLKDVDHAAQFQLNISDYAVTGELRNFQTQLSLSDMLGKRLSLVPLAATGRFQFSGEVAGLRGDAKDAWPSHGSLELSDLKLRVGELMYHLQDSLLNIQPDALRLERFQLVSRLPSTGLLSSQPPLVAGLSTVGAADASTRMPDLERGRVVGSALIRRDIHGEHLLNLRAADLHVKPYIADLAPPRLHGLNGQIDIETRLSKPAAEPLSLVGWQGQFVGRLRDISFRDVPLSELAFSGRLQPDRLALQLNGGLYGGELDVKADIPMTGMKSLLALGSVPANAPQTASASPAYDVDATLKTAQLNRVMSTIFGPRAAAQYAGTADLRFHARSSPAGNPLVDASLTIPNFKFGRKSLAQDLQAAVRYRDGNLLIDNFSGGIAGGRLNVAGNLREDALGSVVGNLRFSAEQLQLSAMTAWIAPEQVDRFSGTFTYSGRGLVGREIQLTGAARLSDAVLGGYQIQSIRSPMNIWLERNGRVHEVSTRSLSGTALGGSARGSARLHGDTRYQFTSEFQIDDGKLDQLSRALGFERVIGSGRFDAQAALRSNDAGNLSALAGPLRLDFQRGAAGAVPILADLGRLLPILQINSTEINGGRLNAQFGQGQLWLQNFYLTSDAFWLVGNGTTSLSTGALDIAAVLDTGGGLETQIVQGASQRIIAAALPQLLLFTQLNDLVRNRTVYLRIGGRTSQPVIQPQVAPTLARGLLQNIRRSLLATPALGAIGASAAAERN